MIDQETFWCQNSSRIRHVSVPHNPEYYLNGSRTLFKDLSPHEALFSGATAATISQVRTSTTFVQSITRKVGK
jgi:hypothetical protein